MTSCTNSTQVGNFAMSSTTGRRCHCYAWMRSWWRHWRITRCSCRTSYRPNMWPTSWRRCPHGRTGYLWPTPSFPSGLRCSVHGPTWKASLLAPRTSAHRCLRWCTELITHSCVRVGVLLFIHIRYLKMSLLIYQNFLINMTWFNNH